MTFYSYYICELHMLNSFTSQAVYQAQCLFGTRYLKSNMLIPQD